MSIDDAYSGQQIQCPHCAASLTVPARQAPAQESAGGQSLVPKPPSGGSRLSTKHNAQQAAKTGDREIPIRQFKVDTGPKKNWALESVKILALLAILGVGGYYGYNYFIKKGDSEPVDTAAAAAPAAPAAPAAGEGQPAGAEGSTPPATDPSGATPNPDGSTPAPQEPKLPVIPPTHATLLSLAKIADSQVNGSINGEKFVAETIRAERTATSQVLRFIQGNPASPDREILIYLRLRTGEKLGGQTYNISTDMTGSSVPQVAKRWKADPRYAPRLKSFGTGYTMKLELGQPTETAIPGKVFLALPDPELSVIAGVFKIQTATPDGQDLNQPMPAPSMNPAMQAPGGPEGDAYRKRYGLPAGR